MLNRQRSLYEHAVQDGLRLAYFVAAGLLVGWLLGASLLGVLVGVLAFGGMNMKALYTLYHWLRNTPTDTAPELSGLWQDIAYHIERTRRHEDKAKARLKAVIEQIQTSMINLEDAIVVLDNNHSIEFINTAAIKILGLKETDQGLPIKNLIRSPAFVGYFEKNDYSHSINIPSWVQAGRYVQLKLTRFGSNGKLLWAHDNTQLQRLEQVRKDFVSNVSHELRTPLTVLMGQVEQLKAASDLAPAMAITVQALDKQVGYLNNLVSDLLTLSYLESGRYKAANVWIDMMDLCVQAQQAHQPLLPPGGQINLEILSPSRLKGSAKEVNIVLNNLLVNALRYCTQTPQIVVRWQTDNHGGYLTVIDNGVGIASEHLNRLSERFYRVDSARQLDSGGSGLGLSIVNHVLQAHDARLSIVSELGKGSQFSCVFAKARIEITDFPHNE